MYDQIIYFLYVGDDDGEGNCNFLPLSWCWSCDDFFERLCLRTQPQHFVCPSHRYGYLLFFKPEKLPDWKVAPPTRTAGWVRPYWGMGHNTCMYWVVPSTNSCAQSIAGWWPTRNTQHTKYSFSYYEQEISSLIFFLCILSSGGWWGNIKHTST